MELKALSLFSGIGGLDLAVVCTECAETLEREEDWD